MNWFDTSGLTSLAKTALKEAQKTIDKALDIQDESSDEQEGETSAESKGKASPSTANAPQKDSDFFASWGLTVSAESSKDDPMQDHPVVTESPSKSTPQTMWGSFAGSFFEQPKTDDTIVRPPKAKSMNVISDSKYDSQDDLFSKSQLVMADGDVECKPNKLSESKIDDRRGSSKSNRLSLVSSRNSSDSVEVLSQSMKTTPDSEASVHSISHSSSTGLKRNSESVEILPDSLVSPSSIECLGFDSYSEKNSSSSSILSPDSSDKKSTSIGDKTEKAETADSVSLVADDDEDTMSYNSVSECTAPTVLDTDNKRVSPFLKPIRTEPQRKVLEKDFINLDQPILPQKMQISENSSNDGSWSDRTLNADNDSINLDVNIEEQKKEEQEDCLIDKLSDSSSFYNVNVSAEMLRSDSSAFISVEKQQCNASASSESSQKDGSVKERTSPISSDSKSDLVKIGSDRTSGHTSGDELETATSSDIEIIPSPNGDSSHSFCRSSPAKYAFKHSKLDGTTSPNIVDLVLGKSLASKIRGHNRELSEVSIQSNTSDESQGSENDRLMRRLCEMAEILEARENRLMEVSRSNAELAENNADLKSQVESLLAKHEVGDINMITEDYTQRMSALEKKFQQAIREKDQLRKQLDAMKTESSSRKNSSEFENSLKEKDDMISQLQEEGEKLARQQLQHSNIIKKLRTKEKDNEQVIKGLRDKISELTAELDRVRRSMAAKEELEVSQIEAVYRLTTANKKMEMELSETKSALDDATQRLESNKTSLDAARRELAELQRSSGELTKHKAAASQLQADCTAAVSDAKRYKAQLDQLRIDMKVEERRWIAREEALRREITAAREQNACLQHAADTTAESEGPQGVSALLSQLAALQTAAVHRDGAHARALAQLQGQRAEAETLATKAIEREKLTREENQLLLERLAVAEGLAEEARGQLTAAAAEVQVLEAKVAVLEGQLQNKISEVESSKEEHEAQVASISVRVSELEQRLEVETHAHDTEKKRNAILQEQLSNRGEASPSHSVVSDTLSASLWPDSLPPLASNPPAAAAASALTMETTLSTLTRRRGEAVWARTDDTARAQLAAARAALAALTAELDELRPVQEQYDALLQMYGEKEEQLAELRLDLQDVTRLYKAQLDDLVALRGGRPA